MSNLLKDASILLTPTAYDNGRMNATKPYKDLEGPELVTNGDFSQGTQDWTFNTSGNNQWSVPVSEKASYAGTATDFIITNNILTVGKKYRVSFNILDTNGSTIRLSVNSEAGGSFEDYNGGDGLYTTYLTAGTNYLRIGGSSSGAAFSIDNVSVVEDLSGDFQFERNSAATRVNAQGLVENVQILSPELVSNGNFSQIGTEEVLNGNFSQEGSELIVNGDFATDSDWSYNNPLDSIENGAFNAVDSANTRLQQNFATPLVSGKTYRIEFTISNYVKGIIVPQLLGVTTSGVAAYSNGTFVDYIKATTNHTGFRFLLKINDGGFTGSIDNVSVKEVGQNWNLGNKWSIGENSAIRVPNSTSNLSQVISGISGKTIKVSYEVSNYVGGDIGASADGNNYNANNGNGTFVDYITPTSDNFYLRASYSFEGSVTNISVKEVGQDWNLGGWTIGDGKVFSDGVNTGNINQSNLLNLNSKYRVSVSIKDYNSGKLNVRLGTGTQIFVADSLGDFELELESTTSNDALRFYPDPSDPFNGSITNISLKEITDDTDLPRINYEGFSYQDSLGSELIVNGDFSDGENGWNTGTGNFDVINEKAVVNHTNNSAFIVQYNAVEVGKTYKIEFTISDYVEGRIRLREPFINGELEINPRNGTFIYYGVADSTTFSIQSRFTEDANFKIDNVSVKEYLGQEVVPDSGCGSWLLEPQSTNLLPYSEDFSQWNNISATLTSGYLAPDGTLGASRFLASGNAFLYNSFNVTIGAEYTISFWVKSNGSLNNFFLHVNGNNSPAFTATDAWQRFEHTFTAVNTSHNIGIACSSSGADLQIWGAQLEQLSYATSYIPTNGAANTRLQDIANNSGNSSLINSTEGVLYAEIAALETTSSGRTYITITDGTDNNRASILFSTAAANQIRTFLRVGGVTQVDVSDNVSDVTNFNKIAFSYKENDFKLYINGALASSDTSGSVWSTNTINKLTFSKIGTTVGIFKGKVKALAVYKEAKTDANLRCLTYPNPVATTFDLDFDTIAEQFTFTRGSEATFVNEQGLIESTNQIGPELVTNGDFATDSDWTFTSGWTISNGKLVADNATSITYQGISAQPNKSYKVTFTISDYTSGNVKFQFLGGSNSGTLRTSVGTYTEYITLDGSPNGNFAFSRAQNFTGSIDNVSVKEVISATNTPRIDYSTGAKAFLLEPQSTNYSTNSEQPSTWHSSGGVTITANAATSPEGIQNSSLVVTNASSGERYSRNNFGFPSGSGLQTVTTSFFIKYYNNQWVRVRSIYFTGSPANGKGTYFDIQNGVIGTSDATHTAKMEDYGNGWYRCSITFDIDKSVDSGGYGHVEAMVGDNLNTFAAIGQGYYAYGSQGEEFSYPTSYIPSGAASTTRNQELCLDATPVINSTEGTLYAEISALANDGTYRMISISDGTNDNRITLYLLQANKISVVVKESNTTQAQMTYTINDVTDFNKIAFKYKENNFALWINGVEVATDTSGNVPTSLSKLHFSTGDGINFPFFGNTKGLKYYPKALADVQLEDLTTI